MDGLMARYRFGGSLTDFGIEPPSSNAGDVVALLETTGTFWDSEQGGTEYTDLLDSDGATPRSDIETDSDGYLVEFYGPDEVRDGYLDFGAGRRFYIVSLDWQAQQQDISDGRYLGYVDVVDGLEARPSGLTRVIWIGGTSQPANMAVGDVWLSEVTGS